MTARPPWQTVPLITAQTALDALSVDPQAAVRRAASASVARAEGLDSQAWMREIMKLVRHSSSVVRCAALEILGRVEGDDALIALLDAAAVRWLRGRDIRTVQVGGQALGKRLHWMFGPWERLAGNRVVLRLAAHRSPRVRLALAKHFSGALRSDLEAMRTVLGLLSDPDRGVRNGVFLVLAKERLYLLVKAILKDTEMVPHTDATSRLIAGAVTYLKLWDRARGF